MWDKLKDWVLGFTPLKKVDDFFDGKKQALVSLAAALAGTGTIVFNLSNQSNRLTYLLHIAQTPEFIAASGGWMGFFNALKGEKIRSEIAASTAETASAVVSAEVKK